MTRAASGRNSTVRMFDSLSNRLQDVFRTLRGEARSQRLDVVRQDRRRHRWLVKNYRVVELMPQVFFKNSALVQTC